MRPLTYLVAMSVDGFIALPDGSFDVFTPSPDYLQAIIDEYPETLPTAAREALGVSGPSRRFDTVVEGRKSYQVGLDAGVPDAYPHLRHVVFSRTLAAAPTNAVEIHDGDPVLKVPQLKRESSLGVWLVGGATLAAALIDEIDELVVKVNPVVLGAGIPLFNGLASPRRLTHRSTRTISDGTIFVTYAA